MMEKPKYGDIVEALSSSPFWTTGTLFKVIVDEGDGKLGQSGHSLCIPFGNDRNISNDYFYELKWDSIQLASKDKILSGIDKKIKPVEKQAEMLNKTLANLKKVKQMVSEEEDIAKDNIKDFVKELTE